MRQISPYQTLPAENNVANLAANSVTVTFEGLVAVDTASLVLERGEIVGLIGPNGAGKTTLVNVISGFQRPTAGSVEVSGKLVTHSSPKTFVKLKVARTFQGGRPFKHLTVRENVEIGALGVGARASTARKLARELLEVLNLADRADDLAGALPFGDDRRLGIARALATSPDFLLLDEPAAGMNDAETDALVVTLRELRASHGFGVLVIEHDMRLIRELPERIYVLDQGAVLAEGPVEEVMNDRAVVTAYLGEEKS
jgi:branched-chain amino acid transport system ATP-binding protein